MTISCNSIAASDHRFAKIFISGEEAASVHKNKCSERAKKVRGTAVYFFELEEVRELFASAGFEVLQLEYIHRLFSKSGKNAKNISVNGGAVRRTRVWVHGRFRKSQCEN